MIRLTVFLFAALFFFRPALPLVAFVVNYDFIVRELCINKDNDKSDCHGKCQLKKELANASSHGESTPAQKQKFAEVEVLFFEQMCLPDLFKARPMVMPVADFYSNHYRFSQSHLFFHPPASV